MRILVTGATGLVGTAFTSLAAARHYDIVALTRKARSEHDIEWDPQNGTIQASRLEGFDAVVHLAGDSIAAGRWSQAKKTRIRDSRVQGTKLLCKTLAQLKDRPSTLISASAIGYYGDRGDQILDENSAAGSLFLSELCKAWEQATAPANDAGIRVVNARIGVVLSPQGGALAQMLTPFRLGVGGIVGNGRQYWSWIALEDLTHAFLHAISNDSLRGPVNFVSPQPTTNTEFTKALGKALHRPTLLPMPAFAAKMALGEMATELLLASARVIPSQLTESGYEFRHADLTETLKSLVSEQPNNVAAAATAV